MIDRVREYTQAAWELYLADQKLSASPQLWGDQYELRVIEDKHEIKSLRDFIVQKMLGGEELSDLGLDDLEDDLDL